MSTAQRCSVCDGALHAGLADWHSVCSRCGTEASSFEVTINVHTATASVDEAARARGLAPLRREGHRRLLAGLERVRGKRGGALLEIGSAHGWFVDAASASFERVVGIEPDDAIRAGPSDPKVEIRRGYFPDALAPAERFDAIVFNDVFEHIPHARRTARAVVDALAFDGVAAVNLPVREGSFYRLARLMHRFGVRRPFERMWQKGFPSPHLYYFSERGLVELFGAGGCDLAATAAMPTLELRGLWSRIRYGEPRLPFAVAVYVAALCALPVLRLLPADVRCFYFRKRRSGSAVSA